MNELKERLLRHIEIDENDCWVWQGAEAGKGYGYIRHEGKTKRAHRVAYELFVGAIPEGLDLDHLCRVRLCCNPAHLEPVTRAENIQRGESAKLDWNKVREIRRLYKAGFIQKELARIFGVSRPLISFIVRNKMWVEEVAA